MKKETWQKMGKMITAGVLSCDYQNDNEYNKYKEEAQKITQWVYTNDKELWNSVTDLLKVLGLMGLWRGFDFCFIRILAFLHEQQYKV